MIFRKKQPGTMSCRTAAKHLQAYLDHEMDDNPSLAQLEGHLERCRDCGLEADTYRSIQSVLRGQAPVVDKTALSRLRSFGQELAQGNGSGDRANPGSRAED